MPSSAINRPALRSWSGAIPYRHIAVVIAGSLVTCLLFYPGCMSGDARFSWSEALTNASAQYHDWHPPLVAYAWRVLNKLPIQPVPQYANLFIGMVLLFWIGVALAAEPYAEKLWLWSLFCCAVGLFPPVAAIMSQPLKDGLLCAALTAAYGGLIVAQTRGSRGAFAFGFAYLFLAMGFRHNAVLAVFPLALWAARIFVERFAAGTTWFKRRRLAGLLLGLAAALFLISASWITNRALTKATSYPIQGVLTFDLVGMSALSNKGYLPSLFDDYSRPPNLQGFFGVKGSDIQASPRTLENIKLIYSPVTNLNIYWYGPGKGLRFIDDRGEMLALAAAWLQAIGDDPLTYLRVRGELFLALFNIKGGLSWPYYCFSPQDSGEIAHRPLPQFYLTHRDSILFKGYAYLIGIVLIVLAAFRWPSFVPVHVRYLAWSGMLYGLGYLFVTADSHFRYLYWLIVVWTLAVVGIICVAIQSRSRAPQRVGAPPSGPAVAQREAGA